MQTLGRKPVVTVVIPVYNRTAYLRRTLESVLAQTWPDWELIVVDDGSAEDVAAVLEPYREARFGLVQQANRGNAAARNAGIAQASGDYLVCLDSDDVWQPKFLAACLESFRAHREADVVYTQWLPIDTRGTVILPIPQPEPSEGDLLAELLLGLAVLPSTALIARGCFQTWGAYTPGMDDWEMWLRWAAHGCRFACVAKPLVHYRLHDSNLADNWPVRREAHFAMLDHFFSQPDLPTKAYDLHDRAYATQHFRFAVLGWETGRPAEALADFLQAVRIVPGYLHDLACLTAVACAHQGKINAGTASGLDLAAAEQTLLGALSALFVQPGLSLEVRRLHDSAYGCAYVALGRLAYGIAHDMRSARRFFLKAAAAWPQVAWHTDWLAWLGRSLVGYDCIQGLKQAARSGTGRSRPCPR